MFNIPIIFEYLIEIFSYDCPSVDFLNITPKRLKFWTLSILVSSVLSRKGIHFLFLTLCIMYLDFFIFFIFKDSLFIFRHSFTLFNYVFKCYSIYLVHEFKDWIVVNRVVSPAYITYLNVLLDFGRSLMYITKRSGPIMEPCGTPVVIGRVSEMLSSYVTYCFLFFK